MKSSRASKNRSISTYGIIKSSLGDIFSSKLIQFLLLLIVCAITAWEVSTFTIILPLLFLVPHHKRIWLDWSVSSRLLFSELGFYRWVHAIEDNILQGGIPIDKLHLNHLCDLGVTHVISFLSSSEQELTTLFGASVTSQHWKRRNVHHHLFIYASEDMLHEQITSAINLLDSLVIRKQRVYCHCSVGRDWSAAVIIGYLCKICGRDLDQSYKDVKSRNKQIFDRNSPVYSYLQRYTS